MLDAIVSRINSAFLVFILLELVATTDVKAGGRHGQRPVGKPLIGIQSSVICFRSAEDSRLSDR
jgi:hypothetical protein